MLTALNNCFGRTYSKQVMEVVFLGVQIFQSNAVALHLLFASIIHLCG